MKQLIALTRIEFGKDEKPILKGTVFKAEDDKMEQQLFSLGAVAEHTSETEALESSPATGAASLGQGPVSAETEEALRAEYQKLYGEPPHPNMKFDTIRARVEEKNGDSKLVGKSEDEEKKSTKAQAVSGDADKDSKTTKGRKAEGGDVI